MTTAAEFLRHRVSGVAISVRGLLAITVVGSAFVLGAPAAATGLHDTERVLAHTKNECLDLRKSQCRTIRSRRVGLDAGALTNIELACGPKLPYVVAWDAVHHEHIGLTLVSDPPNRFPSATAATTPVQPESVTVQAHNQDDARGFVRLFIGCAAQPVDRRRSQQPAEARLAG